MHEQGLNQFLVRWKRKSWKFCGHPKTTIRDVQTIVSEEEPLSFNTVMTVMNRLIEKGLLKNLQGER